VLSYQRPRDFAWGSAATSLSEYARIDNLGWADRRRVLSSIEAAIDRAIALGVADPDRIGITGLSDGVPTVQFALLNSTRFRAAVVSSCCDDPFGSLYAGGPVYADQLKAHGYPAPGEDRPAFWADYSLAVNARRVAAPILVNAPDREYLGAMQAVANLREAGKPIELRVFPDEYHIKWQPAHRSAIYADVLDWFDFWLRGREDPVPAKAAQYRRWRALRDRSTPSAPLP
jgi:dipeptidyl aminopeptidase/acylaminoacyl peptidase